MLGPELLGPGGSEGGLGGAVLFKSSQVVQFPGYSSLISAL